MKTKVFDVQRTNYLEFKELMCGFSILCKGTLDEKLKRMFSFFALRLLELITTDDNSDIPSL